MYKYLLWIFLCISSRYTAAQTESGPTHEETINFIEESIRELQKSDPAGEVPVNLKEFYNWFQLDMATCEKQKYFEDFLERITNCFKQQGKFATVKLATKDSGAIIKFQTIFEQIRNNPPRQADNPTNNCTMKLAPGQYYIWSEREGKPTSDTTRRVYIKMDSSLITINESQ